MSAEPAVITMRTPCPCGELAGTMEYNNGQRCVYCAACGLFRYNAPKSETGVPVRSVARTWLKPAQKYRILERASFRCEFCGADLHVNGHHVDHIISVSDCLHFGLEPADINADENLAALCEECNLGKGSMSVPPLALMVLALRAARRRRPTGGSDE